jgi:peptidoglycan/LPS O-acetylase OafA/YrhL
MAIPRKEAFMSVLLGGKPVAPGATLLESKTSRKSILGLDMLRIMAALIVTVHHLAFGTLAFWQHTGVTAAISPFFWFGWIGVQLFFVISGFVIPYSARNASLKSFLVSRATRLYPAAWICATFTAVDLLLTHTPPQFAPHLAGAWLRSILLSPAGTWVDGVYWTLAIEMCFYTLIAVILGLGRFQSIGKIMGTLGALSTTGWILFLLCHFQIVHQKTLVWIATKACYSRTGQYSLLEYGCYFALGTLFWEGFSDRFTAARKLLIAYCVIGGSCGIISDSINIRGSATIAMLQPLIFWLASMVALAVLTRYNTRVHALFGERGAKLVRRMGLATYPLYLLHQQNGYIWIRRLHGVFPDLASLSLVIFSVCLLSLIISRFAEEPLQRRFKRLLLRGHPNIADAPSPVAASLP